MFNKFLISVIFTIMILNIIFIYLAFIKGDKITRQASPPQSRSPTPTNQLEDPFSELDKAIYPNADGIDSSSCVLYTHEENTSNKSIIGKNSRSMTTNNVFPYVLNNKAHSYYDGDCYDEDQLFAKYVTHTCQGGTTGSIIKNRCYSQTGRVISFGESENFTNRCNDNKCDGNIGYLSFNFNLTNDNSFKDLLVIDKSSKILSITGVCLPQDVLNDANNGINKIFNDDKLSQYYNFVRQDITPSKIPDEYPITYSMTSTTNNDFKSKLKLTRYNYGVSGTDFGVCENGLYGSIIFRPLNMYLTIGTSYIDEQKTLYNITGVSTVNLVLKKYDETKPEESIVWMFMPSIDFFNNLIPTTTRCSYYYHSPQECIGNDETGTCISGTLRDPKTSDNSFVIPDDTSHQTPVIKNINCDNSFMREQVNIGTTVIQSNYINNTWLVEDDFYMTDDQSNFYDNAKYKKFNTITNGAGSRRVRTKRGTYNTRGVSQDPVIKSFPYYTPLYDWNTDDSTDSDSDDDIPIPPGTTNLQFVITGGTNINPIFKPYIASDDHIYCIKNSNGDIKTVNDYIIYPKIGYQSLTGGLLSNVDFLEPESDSCFLLNDDLMNNFTEDKEFNKISYPDISSGRREVLFTPTKNIATKIGGSVFIDGDVIWKPINPYNNVITFPNEYFMSSSGNISTISISSTGSGYKGYDESKYDSLLNFSYEVIPENFNLNWYDQIINYEHTDNNAVFQVIIQNNSVQNIIIQDPGEGFSTQPGSSIFILLPDDVLKKPTISINVLETFDRTYSYQITNIQPDNGTCSGYGLTCSGFCISPAGSIKIETDIGKTNETQLKVEFSGQNYKVNDMYQITEYDLNEQEVINNNKATITVTDTKEENDIYALDAIDKSLYIPTNNDFKFGDYSLKMVTEQTKENYCKPSPPQICFVGDFLDNTNKSKIDNVIEGSDIKKDSLIYTKDLLKLIIPESDTTKFLTFFNLLKLNEFTTETSCDFFKTLQFEKLNYRHGTSVYGISESEQLILGKFIPYSRMTMFSSNLTNAPKFEGISGGQIIPGQYYGNDYTSSDNAIDKKIKRKIKKKFLNAKNRALVKEFNNSPTTKIADKGKTDLYNNNYTQFIPYGLDDLNNLTSF